MGSLCLPKICILQVFICFVLVHCEVNLDKSDVDSDTLNTSMLNDLSKLMIPSLKGKVKGDIGKIGVIGGSTEYTGAPYFSAITSLKVGADMVFVITTESAAPVIKAYSPDLIVYPFLDAQHLNKIKSLLMKMDVVVVGPGLGREDETLSLVYGIIQHCKLISKPLVIDADGIYVISKNPSILSSYPEPGVILTPNIREAELLKKVLNTNETWYDYWGEYVSVLVKGKEDRYYAPNYMCYAWSLTDIGSDRRAAGQGDILAGSLGTFYNWALKINFCDCLNTCKSPVQLAKSVAVYAAAKFTRACNFKAFAYHGRSMLASDMLLQIHPVFDELFEKGNKEAMHRLSC